MITKLISTIRQHQAVVLLGLVLFIGLFFLGYRQILQIKQLEPLVPSEPIPPRVPREYKPDDSLLDLRLERDRQQSQEVERVQEILEKIGLSDEVRKEAERELWRLSQAIFKEHELENILGAKGFKESLVTISPRLVTVVVNAKIQQDQAKSIGEMTAEVTGYNLEQIQIVED